MIGEDPGYCGSCLKEKLRAKHLNVPWEEISANTSGNFAGKLKVIKSLVYPFEYDDESSCGNVNCVEGQENIVESIGDANRNLEHTARSGDWTKVDREHLEYLEQLSNKANEIADVAEIDWLGNDIEELEKIRNKIDKFEDNRNRAIERTAEVASSTDRRVQGRDRIAKCDNILSNFDDLRHNIYVQDMITDHINRIANRTNEQEVAVEKKAAPYENEEDEQQERNTTHEKFDNLSKEELIEEVTRLQAENEELEVENGDLNAELDSRDETIQKLEAKNEELTEEKRALIDEKQELVDKIQTLTDDKMELLDEKQELSGENLDLKEEVQNLRSKLQQLENEQESEADVEATPERDHDGEQRGAAGAVRSGGDGPPPPTGATATETATETHTGASGESATSSTDGGDGTQSGAAEQNAPESQSQGQRWVENPDAEMPDPIPEKYEALTGKSAPSEFRNGHNNDTDGPDREDEQNGRDDIGTTQEQDDEPTTDGYSR